MTAQALPVVREYDPVAAGARCDLCPLKGTPSFRRKHPLLRRSSFSSARRPAAKKKSFNSHSSAKPVLSFADSVARSTSTSQPPLCRTQRFADPISTRKTNKPRCAARRDCSRSSPPSILISRLLPSVRRARFQCSAFEASCIPVGSSGPLESSTLAPHGKRRRRQSFEHRPSENSSGSKLRSPKVEANSPDVLCFRPCIPPSCCARTRGFQS